MAGGCLTTEPVDALASRGRLSGSRCTAGGGIAGHGVLSVPSYPTGRPIPRHRLSGTADRPDP